MVFGKPRLFKGWCRRIHGTATFTRFAVLSLCDDRQDSAKVFLRQKRVLLLLNVAQIGLFGLIHAQIFSTFGRHHYTFDREPAVVDWIELTLVHVLRAVDLIDCLEEYGIDLQNVKHNSALSGCLLVRLLDVGDTMQIFHWRLHGVAPTIFTMTLAVTFRLLIGLYLAEWMKG